jgi:hypothetical protein
MPTPTYTLIDSVTLTSSAASVSFTGISATGKGDLVLVMSASTSTNKNTLIKINADTGLNYNVVSMEGNGTTTTSFSQSNVGSMNLFPYYYDLGTTKGVNTVQFIDFSATDKHKSVLARGGNASNVTAATAHRWASSSAITSLEVYVSGDSFAIGSTFNLYQIVSE